MKSSAQIVEALNLILTGELTAINQSLLHARMCKERGYEHLAKKLMDESCEEREHVNLVIDRILFLGGIPNLRDLEELNVGKTAEDQLAFDRTLDEGIIDRLKFTIELCYNLREHGTREMLESILKDEETHLHWLEAQLGIIQDVGLGNYLAQQIAN